MKTLAAILLTLGSVSYGDNIAFTSGNQKTAVLELYSSEGCSSCPPADIFFSGLRKTDGLWTRFVPVGFHVDYWNRLGWVDKFSQKRFTQRQREYARQWQSRNVYTPGLIFDGTEWKGWRSRFPALPNQSSGKLQISIDPSGQTHITFQPLKPGKYQVFAVLMGNGIQSKVLSGENSGRTLSHDFVVLDLKNAPLNASSTKPSKITLDGKWRAAVNAPQYSLSAWVEPLGKHEPIQAAGGDLPKNWRP